VAAQGRTKAVVLEKYFVEHCALTFLYKVYKNKRHYYNLL